jgi:hypothetical protein
MKKLAIGCGVVLVLVGIAVAGLGYYAYRRVQSTVAQFAELGQIPDIERGVRVRAPYVPPATEELTASQVERLVRVQTLVRQRLGQRFAEFEQKYKTLSEKDTPSLGDLPTLLGAYSDMAAAWLDAKRGQVDALNEVGLSLEEYRWIRDQAYGALGVPYVDLDIGKIADDIRNGQSSSEQGRLRGALEPSGPEPNRRLIEAFKKQLQDNIALASFGL